MYSYKVVHLIQVFKRGNFDLTGTHLIMKGKTVHTYLVVDLDM